MFLQLPSGARGMGFPRKKKSTTTPNTLIGMISKEVCSQKKVRRRSAVEWDRLLSAVGSRRSRGAVCSGRTVLAIGWGNLLWALNAHVPNVRGWLSVTYSQNLQSWVDWKFSTWHSSVSCDCPMFDAGYARRNLTSLILKIFTNSHKVF